MKAHPPSLGLIHRVAQTRIPIEDQRYALAALRVDGLDAICLVQTAIGALEREIVEGRSAIATSRHDVIDMKDGAVSELEKMAVLTAPFVTQKDRVAQRLTDRRARHELRGGGRLRSE